MSRERDFYRKMKEDARNSMYEPEIIDVSPPAKKVKTNYLSAVVWTSVVATVVCTIFMGLLLYVVNESRIEERLEQAASHALYNLEATIKAQSEELQKLQAENKKIHKYLQLWTPIDLQRLRRQYENKNKPPTEDDLFNLGPDIIIKDLGLPQSLPPLRRFSHREKLCLPFLE